MLKSKARGAPKDIHIMDRLTNSMIRETVFSEGKMQLLYGNPIGLAVTSRVLTTRWLNALYGAYHDSAASRSKIGPFIDELNINLDECAQSLDSYRSFNDFFARKLKESARPIAGDERSVVSPADGRMLVFPHLQTESISHVKWAPIRLLDLFGTDSALAARYQGGACLIARLCPADYHRFHFPVSGRAGPTRLVPGRLHSVSPYALEQKIPVYCLNKRTLTEIQTPNAGTVLYMEIGALLVGSIVQTFAPQTSFERGEEKGYFKFGGSTVIVFFEPNRITFDPDLVQNSSQHIETLVRMGEQIAVIQS